MAGYVLHRLSVTGIGRRVEFDDGALELMYQLSAGVPRLVNLICDRALAEGHRAAAPVIDRPIVETAALALGLTGGRSAIAKRLLVVLALVLLTLAGAATAA